MRDNTKINLSDKFAQFNTYWDPKIAGEVNDSYVKLVKFKGEFVWHHHADEDELFLVVKGAMKIHLKDAPAVDLRAGEFYIVPKGVEHKPEATDECHCLLFERKTVLNTGNVRCDMTKDNLGKI